MDISNKLKANVARRLSGTRAYVPLRNVYQAVFNRRYVHARRARCHLFRQFLKPGSLVFDVGANVGIYADVFLRLGAKVVAVEPNPECCEALRALGRGRLLAVRCEGMSDEPGEATLFVGEHSGHSTVSQEWMQTASREDAGYRWKNEIRIRLNTLDRLCEEYGTPDFIKIDVEGFEHSALRGMSFQPSALSFEFHALTSGQMRTCLELAVFDSGCSFNIVLDESHGFVWDDWRPRNQVFEYVSTLPVEKFGDIFVKFD
jgi:FkbM family methyltransferase